jgi:hypothetical protein
VPNHRRVHVALILVAALVLVAAIAAACSAQASSETDAVAASSGTSARSNSGGSDATQGGSAGAGAKSGANDDWSRIAQVLAWMQADPPTKPVVVLLGGSSTRESTISDKSWRDQIVATGGPSVLAWNMGSHNRSMAQNLAIAKALPQGARTIVLIGINLGSFTGTQKSAKIKLPSLTGGEISLQQPHQYGVAKTGILSPSEKKAALQNWLSQRYPVYKANFSTNAAILEKIIKRCKARNYKPVLFELPRNTQIIGNALAAPTNKFRAKCVALHKKYDVPWISLVSTAKIPNTSFYDLWHLVEPGRKVWQKLLSAKTAALLKQYGFDGGGS